MTTVNHWTCRLLLPGIEKCPVILWTVGIMEETVRFSSNGRQWGDPWTPRQQPDTGQCEWVSGTARRGFQVRVGAVGEVEYACEPLAGGSCNLVEPFEYSGGISGQRLVSLSLPRHTRLAAVVARAPHVDYSIWTATHRWVRFLEPAQHAARRHFATPLALALARSFMAGICHLTAQPPPATARLHRHRPTPFKFCLQQVPSSLFAHLCHSPHQDFLQ